MRALTARPGPHGNGLRIGRLTFDVKGRRAFVDGIPVELSARELAVLEVLMSRAGRVVNKDDMMQSLYEWRADVGQNAIEVYVHRVRKKLLDADVRIRTVRGLGYLLEAGAPRPIADE